MSREIEQVAVAINELEEKLLWNQQELAKYHYLKQLMERHYAK